jgi:hypothetical protein
MAMPLALLFVLTAAALAGAVVSVAFGLARK